MSIPTTMKAVKSAGPNVAVIKIDAAVPHVPDDHILIKVSHVALNPTDWQTLETAPGEGFTLGCDFSGTVAQIGANAQRHWSVGDRIATVSHGMRSNWPECGGFGEYAVTRSGLGIKLAPGFDDAEACTFAAGIITIGQALYQFLGLPLPDPDAPEHASSSSSPTNADGGRDDIFIYGGSTATGLQAIQWARLSGLRVLTCCSPRNFELVQRAGAAEAFDYADAAACAAGVRRATAGRLRYAFDCIGEGASTRICAEALTPERGVAMHVSVTPDYEPVRAPDDVRQKWIYGYTAMGSEFYDDNLKRHWPLVQEDYDFAIKISQVAEKLVARGRLRGFPIPREGGLSEEGILKGLAELQAGKVSGGKLVYAV